jgi:hypothetical protein
MRIWWYRGFRGVRDVVNDLKYPHAASGMNSAPIVVPPASPVNGTPKHNDDRHRSFMCYKKDVSGQGFECAYEALRFAEQVSGLSRACGKVASSSSRGLRESITLRTADENSSGVRNAYYSSLAATGLPLSSFRMEEAKFTDDRWSGGGAEAKLLASSRRGGGSR